MNYGIQLWSVNSNMKNDPKETLRKIAEMGYKTIEPCNFSGMTAKEYKSLCDELGLTISGAHLSANFLIEGKADEMIEYLKEVGCPRYILPSIKFDTAEDIDAAVELINKYEPKFRENGLSLMYHNHHREFMFNKDKMFSHLAFQKRTNVKFEIDVYWVYRAGLNPLYVLEQLKDRVEVIHLKDGNMQEGMPIGKGEVPIAEVIEWATKNGVDMVVENEPTAERELEEAKECIDFLKTL